MERIINRYTPRISRWVSVVNIIDQLYNLQFTIYNVEMLKILFNTILGLVLIFVWSRFVDLAEIARTISGVNLFSLLPIFISMFLSPILRAIRLKIFLGEIKKIRLLDLIYLNGVAMFLNFFIPIRAGELAKGIYLNTRYDLKLAKSIIWVFIDRFVDFLVVLLLAGILLIIIPTSLSIIVIKIIIVILTLVLGIAYLAIFKVDFSRKIVKFLTPLFIEKHIKIYFERFSHFILDAFTVLDRHPKDLFLMVIASILAYAADAGVWYFTFIALGFGQDFIKMYLGQLLSALTYLIPAAPGYVGSAEASGLLILSGIFKINANLASSMIVLFHLLTALFVLIFGLISIFNLKINLGLVLKKVLRKGV